MSISPNMRGFKAELLSKPCEQHDAQSSVNVSRNLCAFQAGSNSLEISFIQYRIYMRHALALKRMRTTCFCTESLRE